MMTMNKTSSQEQGKEVCQGQTIYLIVSDESPLSTQLENITGDSYSQVNYECVDKSPLTSDKPFRHIRTGQVFIAETEYMAQSRTYKTSPTDKAETRKSNLVGYIRKSHTGGHLVIGIDIKALIPPKDGTNFVSLISNATKASEVLYGDRRVISVNQLIEGDTTNPQILNKVCPNCEQWIDKNGDCLNECHKKNLA